MATDKTRAVGVDIGGTGIKAAIVDLEAGTLLSDRIKVATPVGAEPKDVLAAVMKVLEKLGGAPKPAETGGAEPAPAETGGAEPAPAETGGAEPAPAGKGGEEPVAAAPAVEPSNDEIMAIIQQILDKLAKQREEQAAADAAAAAPAKA